MNVKYEQYGTHATAWCMSSELADNGDGTYTVNDTEIAATLSQGSEIVVIDKPGKVLLYDPATSKAYDWSTTGGGGGGGDDMKFLIVEAPYDESRGLYVLNKTAREIFAAAPFVYLNDSIKDGDSFQDTYVCFGENSGDVFSGSYNETEGVRLPTEAHLTYTCASLDDYPTAPMPE